MVEGCIELEYTDDEPDGEDEGICPLMTNLQHPHEVSLSLYWVFTESFRVLFSPLKFVKLQRNLTKTSPKLQLSLHWVLMKTQQNFRNFTDTSPWLTFDLLIALVSDGGEVLFDWLKFRLKDYSLSPRRNVTKASTELHPPMTTLCLASQTHEQLFFWLCHHWRFKSLTLCKRYAKLPKSYRNSASCCSVCNW